MNSLLNSVIRQTARKLSISPKQAEAIYSSYWKYIRETIESLPVRNMTEEEFEAATTNFNIPYIGKLYVEYGKIKNYQRQLKRYQDARSKENQANRQSDTSD